MASTQYNSIIELFRGCPFSIDGGHTLEPSSLTSKVSWLEANCDYNVDDRFENVMYVRCDSSTNKGTFRLECLDSRAYDYNYAYVDNARGNTYFAYITGCRYLNDATSDSTASKSVYEFEFTLDLLMTNLRSTAQLKPCLVLRQHNNTDNIGDNIERDITRDNYVLNGNPINKMKNSGQFHIIIQAASDTDRGTIVDGNYSGCALYAYPLDVAHLSAINSKIDSFSSSKIVDVYVIPTSALGDPSTAGLLPSLGYGVTTTYQLTGLSGTETLDGYTPKNKKMYTFPYTILRADTGDGSSMFLKYEGFVNHTPVINVYTAITKPAIATAYPAAYKGTEASTSLTPYVSNLTESMSWKELPNCSWTYDNFKSWLSSSGLSLVANSIANLAMGNPAGVAGAAINTATSVMGKNMYESNNGFGASLKGNTASYSNALANDTYGLWISRMTLNANDAKDIDNYFTRYGYAQNKVMQPNPIARPYYTFIQTGEDCYVNKSGTVQGGANAKQMKEINDLLKAGVTFWRRSISTDTIFKYDTLDNSPT